MNFRLHRVATIGNTTDIKWLWGKCSGNMATPVSLKHVATEPTGLDNKRERVRRGAGGAGAAGRAAVLRRAPSDSDCSGETASLSADSADRVRSVLPPPRHTKARRRRGSEWEVLEGLKDGQRFERRPEVFNGYLHKKRKWPLKGWHKRFFVIDGGILVYARSPTDVARGRLHGSVDVGLSVISAKARRRRIDIDADEFIYHLRAKTPDVFRTWLNVLKVHRLYRQHLLTFGAREAVPKIHAPLEDIPPPDSSSQSICSSDMSIEVKCKSKMLTLFKKPSTSSVESAVMPAENKVTYENPVQNWNEKHDDDEGLIPLNFAPLFDELTPKPEHKPEHKPAHSLCSMHCMETMYKEEMAKLKQLVQLFRVTKTDQLVLSADLDKCSPKVYPGSKSDSYTVLPAAVSITPIESITAFREQTNSKMTKKFESPFCLEKENAFFLFTKNKIHSQSPYYMMRKSNKATNLVKYRNVITEAPLPKPMRRNILRANLVSTVTSDDFDKRIDDGIQVKIVNLQREFARNNVDICHQTSEKTNKTLLNHITSSGKSLKPCAPHINKNTHEINWNKKSDARLFHALLRYWVENNAVADEIMAQNLKDYFYEKGNQVQSVQTQVEYSTKDAILSSINCQLSNQYKETQFPSKCVHTVEENPKRLQSCSKYLTYSFIKENRIQQLERLLKSTVYTMETVRSNNVKHKDIEITKKLIDNLGTFTSSSSSPVCKNPSSHIVNSSETCLNNGNSSEFSKIKTTFNRLIGETSIAPAVAKELLGAYLQVLMDDNKGPDDSRSSTEESKVNSEVPTLPLSCDVQTEPVQRQISIGIITTENGNYHKTKPINDDETKALKNDDETKALKNDDEAKETKDDESQVTKNSIIEAAQDSGQLYLKDLLDKVTNYFRTFRTSSKKSLPDDTEVERTFRTILEVNPCANVAFTDETDDNSIVLDLVKYDLLQMAVLSESSINGELVISIKLKELPPNTSTNNPKNVILKFIDPKPNPLMGNIKENQAYDRSTKNYFRKMNSKLSFKNPYYFAFDPNSLAEKFELKPSLSSTDATSKYKVMCERKDSHESKNDFQKEHQSCYILSGLKKSTLTSVFSLKRKNKKEWRFNTLELHEQTTKPEIKRLDTTITNAKRLDAPTTTSAMKDKSTRIIDEKFILLLLENLTLLSKNIPSLYKEIYSLYSKLKKKHEKVMRKTSGLGLLGKIYNETQLTGDKGTQFDCIFWPVKLPDNKVNDPQVHKAVSAEIITAPFDPLNMINEATSVYAVMDGMAQTVSLFEPKFTSIENGLKHNITITTSVTDFSHLNSSYHFHGNIKGSQSQKIIIRKKLKNIDSLLNAIRHALKSTSRANLNFLIEQKARSKFKNNFPEMHPVTLTNDIITTPTTSKEEIFINNKNLEQSREARIPNHTLKKKSLIRDNLPLPCSLGHVQKKVTRKLQKRILQKEFDIYLENNVIYDPEQKQTPEREVKVLYKPLNRCSSSPSHSAESGGPLENASRELGQAQLSVQQLQRLLDALELQHHHHDTDVSLEGASPNVKKDRRKFGLRKKKSNSKCASVELAPSLDPSGSHMALSALTAPPSPGGGASSVPNSAASLPIACAAARPQSLPGAEALGAGGGGPASLASLTPDQQLREDFTVLAKDLVATLKTVLATLVCERGRLRAAMDTAESTGSAGGAVVVALRTNLTSALQQNSELRSRLSRIHDASDLAEISSVNNTDPAARPFQQSLSYSSSCVSASEFFDAEEHEPAADLLPADETGVIELDGDSSSEAGSLSSEEGSASSDNSDGALLSAEPAQLSRLSPRGAEAEPGGGWSRRTTLPCPRPTPGGPSLWNLLYKNIGKDLSQVSMPVTINEPLNMLQRLCEELEYSELLDAAAEAGSELERMALVSAFAVSAYAASAHRAASKPFNPLLRETYECVRTDKGFRFLAEQVSHHPPISACHAESKRWVFWQEARIKTKFWGKSMEFQPAGRVHVRLTTTGDHYSWNKVTTCVHNLFGGQRWVDQYGDMHITCHGSDITAKLNFIKASSWSSGRHEVRGWVSAGGSGRLRLQGRWSEALYGGEPPAARCLWRPGAMPPEHELYYGFTRFAMELNEMEPGLRDLLPHTDTRLRPDQRALEEGDVDAAERYKLQLERAQRDRRTDGQTQPPAWFRKAVEDGEEMWVFTGEYWRARDAGFPALHAGAGARRIW